MLFDELARFALEEDMKPVVTELLKKKVRMSESDKAPRIDALNEYIEEKLEYYKALTGKMPDDRKPEWEPLEMKFREMLW